VTQKTSQDPTADAIKVRIDNNINHKMKSTTTIVGHSREQQQP